MAHDDSLVTLDGAGLTVGDIVAIGEGRAVALAPAALERCAASRRFLEAALDSGQIVYGVNTSFGPMCGKIVHADEAERLQDNLVRSHAAGLGAPLEPRVARGVMATRLNSLVKGYSGVRVEFLELLRDMLNAGIAPYIPECGSVGASGDLVHLAHQALAVIGEGKAYLRGELTSAAAALAASGLRPAKLGFKEGLALLNGTAAMTAIGAFALDGAERLLEAACAAAAFGAEIFGAVDDAFDPDLHALKPHPGQVAVAAAIAKLVEGSGNLLRRDALHGLVRAQGDAAAAVFETDVTVQDVYCIRCAPQVLAPVHEAVAYARRVLEIEANSSNDNPLVIPERGKIVHGGNFHGQSVSFAMDALRIAVATLCNLSERRLNKLLDKNLNGGLPEHLIVGTAGLDMGFMGAQYLATSTAAENRHLANPMSVNSVSCNAANQDVVSMGTVSARLALRQVDNAGHVQALELLADLQALSFRGAAGLGKGARRVYDTLSEGFEPYDSGQVFHDVLAKFRDRCFREFGG